MMIAKAKVEAMIGQCSAFKGIKIDQVLFEANYPILFTGSKQNEEYLFVCPLVNQDNIVWVATEVTYTTIISLLQNTITIREAFTTDRRKKFLIQYNGNLASCREVPLNDIPDVFLPSSGEYMDAENGEYDEEIEYYRAKQNVPKIIFLPQSWVIYSVTPKNMFAQANGKHLQKNVQDIYASKFWMKEIDTRHMTASVEV